MGKVEMTLTEGDNIHHSNGQLLDNKKISNRRFHIDEKIQVYDCVNMKHKNIHASEFRFGEYLLILNQKDYHVIKIIITKDCYCETTKTN